MGNGESNPVRNMDKRTARREYRSDFEAAIKNYRLRVHGARSEQPSDVEGEGQKSDTCSVRVCVRKRPIFPYELKEHEFDVLTCVENRKIIVHDARMHADMKRQYLEHSEFDFDNVFHEQASNKEVYDGAATDLVKFATEGGFATCLMYGQTGSGKTHTMSAIYEYAAEDIFRQIGNISEASVSISFFELSGDNCCDMLNMFEPAQLMTGRDGSVHAFPLVEIPVENATDLVAMINHGRAVRSTASTGVNDTSSRSHAILRVYISPVKQMGGADEGVLTLVDLAGSEHRIDSMYHGAERRKEGAMINASLMALKECVRARAAGKNFSHHYRKNKLTMALKSSFMLSTAKTVIIATVSPASKDTEHSLNTLRHACIMDGQQNQQGDECEEKRFVTGGVKRVEYIGQVNVSGLSRQRRANIKEGRADRNDAKVSNGNEARPDEHILSFQEKHKLRILAEKKALLKLNPSQKKILKSCRGIIGRNPVQEARLSRWAPDNMTTTNDNPSSVEHVASDRRVSRSIFSSDPQSHFDGPTDQQNRKLVQMGFKDFGDNEPGKYVRKVVHSPEQVGSSPTLFPSENSNQNGDVKTIDGTPADRLTSSPISRPLSSQGNKLGAAINSKSHVEIPREKVEEFKNLQGSMFARRDLPFEVIKRQFVVQLKEKGYSSEEIKALVLATTGENPQTIRDVDTTISAESSSTTSAGHSGSRKSPVFKVSREKKASFLRLKASVFHGAAAGTPVDILVRQLTSLLKQKDFTRHEISFLMRDLKEASVSEQEASSSFRSSSSAGILRRTCSLDDNKQQSREESSTVASGTSQNSRRSRISNRSLLWRPPAEEEPCVPLSRNTPSPIVPNQEENVTEKTTNTDLDIEVRKIEGKLSDPSISEATKFGLKKRLAAMKASVLRAERKAKQMQREGLDRKSDQVKHISKDVRKERATDPTKLSGREDESLNFAKCADTENCNGTPVLGLNPRVASPPHHMTSLQHPDILDQYANGIEKNTTSRLQQNNLPKSKPKEYAGAPQHLSSPPGVYGPIDPVKYLDNNRLEVPKNTDRKSYVGAMSAPFANEMNWNLYS